MTHSHTNPPVLKFENLTLGYDRHPAVHHLEGSIAMGDLFAIIGPNGAGKTTLLKAITGLLSPMGGQLQRYLPSKRPIAYLPQAAEIDRTFPIGVFDMVAMGLIASCGLFGGISRQDQVLAALERVGLRGFENRALNTLSGGQFQRVLFARLLVQNAQLIVLDEPFNAIDSRTIEDLLRLIQHWHEEGRTVIAVLHDLELVRRFFPKTLLIARELIAMGATQDVLTPSNLERARAMVEAPDPHAQVCDAPQNKLCDAPQNKLCDAPENEHRHD